MFSLGLGAGGKAQYSDRGQWQHDPDKGYSVRGYLQKQTWSLEASYHRRLTIVYLVVERSNRLSICSSPATLLVPFGLLFVLESTLHRWIPYFI
ncbi:hypothetical protein L195_g043075 [Trifolium pratense]|uniref:Uncharacterized protein n=1 Tax=Trifolium pratense TaxID=57577 RepID=A0A2K3M865_TRIPR|nr:hypothetical protein L195_g043075 [Trifolium pratense]